MECVVPLRKDKVFVSVVGILALASFKGTNYCIAFTTQMSSQQVVNNVTSKVLSICKASYYYVTLLLYESCLM